MYRISILQNTDIKHSSSFLYPIPAKQESGNTTSTLNTVKRGSKGVGREMQVFTGKGDLALSCFLLKSSLSQFAILLIFLLN